MMTTAPDSSALRPELRHAALDGVRTILAYLGEDPDRPGLAQTPRRVVDALAEFTSAPGDPAHLLKVVFDDAGGVDQMVTLAGIAFASTCEHHLLPFTGTASVAYIPAQGRVVGLSKLARLVEHHARKLQVQERLTEAIADDVMTHLAPLGAGVAITSTHSCMTVRGIRKPGAAMTTTALRGAFAARAETRQEFLDGHRAAL